MCEPGRHKMTEKLTEKECNKLKLNTVNVLEVNTGFIRVREMSGKF